MFLQINQLIFMHLEELSRSAAVISVFLKTNIFSFDGLSVMTLAENSKILSSLIFSCLDVEGTKFSFVLCYEKLHFQ